MQDGGDVDYFDISSNTTLEDGVDIGQYVFNNFVAGNYIVRFIYGSDDDTYLTNGTDIGTENDKNKDKKTELERLMNNKGKNRVSYNGQDYKSTTYQYGTNIYEEWYDLSNYTQNETRMSDAKDDLQRRLQVIQNCKTIQNNRAEILASFDARTWKNSYYGTEYQKLNYYDEELHDVSKDLTWMFADTAKFNVQIEYDTTISNGIDELKYSIPNVDFGLEERPETKLELTKEIIGIKLQAIETGEVLIDTANGVDKNVNPIYNTRDYINGYAYKRNTRKYEYTQGPIHIYVEDEVMNSRLIVDYKITITNKSEVDYTSMDIESSNPSTLGVAYYEGRADRTKDKIVTAKIDKVIDYVDNNFTFREDENPQWNLIIKMYNTETTANAIKLMKDIYLNPNLEIKQTNKATDDEQPIEQVIVVENLGVDVALDIQPEDSKYDDYPSSRTVYLRLSKALQAGEDTDTLTFSNLAEILEYTNTVGRRDMDAIPGNQDPDIKDKGEMEYDADLTERIIITPPTGGNKSIIHYIIIPLAILIITAGIIIIIKIKRY